MTYLISVQIGLIMGLLFALVVVALTGAFRLLHFPDLTSEGSFPIGAAIFAAMLRAGFGLSFALASAACGGAVAGALTGMIHGYLRLNKFLAGIIVVAMSYSLCLRIMNGSNIGLLNAPSVFDCIEHLDNLAGSRFDPASVLFLVVVVGTVATLVSALAKTRLGLRLRLAGTNPDLGMSLGVRSQLALVIGLAFFNSLAAISGALLASYQGFADVGMGQGVLILSLAAMTIGERVVPNRCFSFTVFVVLAAVVGSVLYQIIVAFAVRLGLAPTDLKLVTAILVLGVVALRLSGGSDLLTEGQT